MKQTLTDRYMAGETTCSEERQLRQLLADIPVQERTPEEQAMLDMLSLPTSEDEADIFAVDFSDEYNKVASPRRRLVRFWPLAAAACMAGIVALLQPPPVSEQTSSLSSERAGVRLSPIIHRDVEAVEEAHRAQQQEIRKKGERLAAQIQRQLTEFTPQ